MIIDKTNPLYDFRNFLYLTWQHLNLPDPTPVQYDIADFLQHGPRRIIIGAFRGVGKSWITAAFTCHQLLLDPNKKIEVISASKSLADNFSTFCLMLIENMDILSHLRPRSDQRTSMVQFDVGPAIGVKDPSVKSVGITGQITGTRADIIIADDIEVPGNCDTQLQREKLQGLVKEFDNIIKPDGKIIYLGTPHTEQSLYNVLPERGYTKRLWTGRYPLAEELEAYGNDLAPFIASKWSEEIVGDPVDPKRFNEMDLLEREASLGKSSFQLQFMLNTQLSDTLRYPLKLSDLVVMPVDKEVAPEKVVYGSGPEQLIKDLPNVGFNGDRYYRPLKTLGDWKPYTETIVMVDPAGRGKDETGVGVLSMFNSYLYLHKLKGLQGGYSEDVLTEIAKLAKQYKATNIIVEANFGDGMFTQLLQPVLGKIYQTGIEEVKHSIQKEKRIIDTLEPVMNQHRLVIDPSVILDDYQSCQHLPPEQRMKYMLMYQLTRITRDKGALAHDDRLDTLAIGVNYFVEMMNLNADDEMRIAEEEAIQEEYDKFMEQAIGNWSPQQLSWF